MRFMNSLNTAKAFFGVFVLCSLMYSCKISKGITQKDFLYFQSGLDSIRKIQPRQPVINANDVISIRVSTSSLNQEQVVSFNQPVGSLGYTVNAEGNVEMPVIGFVKASGLTQTQLSELIAEKLMNYVKDPQVIIHFLEFKVNVLGEVKGPGIQKFTADRVTILDAIGAAGDLTDKGKRQDVTIIREENNRRNIYKVDLRSGALFQSPAYILQSNDIVYVGANEQKFKDFKNANSISSYNGLRIFATVLGLFTSVIFAIRLFNN